MTIKPRILFHSECTFFAGCERMLINFFNDQDLRSEFDISFVTGNSMRYIDELTALHQPDFYVCPLRFPKHFHPSQDFKFAPRIVSVLCRKVTEVLYRIPLIVVDVCLLIPHLKRIAPDVVHINNGGYPGNLSSRAMVLAARITGVRSIYMVVNNEAMGYDQIHRWFDRPVDWLISRSISNFITGSTSSSKKLTFLLKLRDQKVLSFPNGVIFRAADESILLTKSRVGIEEGYSGLIGLVVSRFEHRKGHSVLLDAIFNLRQRGLVSDKNLRIIFEGSGPEFQVILEKIKSLDLASMIIIVRDERNIANLYNLSDFLISPSIGEEDFSNVISESMSHGLCVIATKVGGAPEQVVDGVTGFLVAPMDSMELGNAIVKIISDHGFTRTAGICGHDRYLEKFTPKIAVERYLNLYREATAS